MKYFFSSATFLFSMILFGCSSTPSTSTTIDIPAIQISGELSSGSSLNISENFSLDLSKQDHFLSFDLAVGEKITLSVQQPTAKASIRVSQIIMPDGTMDGPFGSELVFIATQSGEHRFIISVNQMASEDIFTGNVDVTVIKN